MTNKYPNLRSHTRRRKGGKVVTYYFFDRRAAGEKDIPLGTDYDSALEKWAEISKGGPRIAGTLEQAFQAWEADKVTGLGSYTNADTLRDYTRALRKLRPVFGTATWEAVEFTHLTIYLRKRTAKTRANREIATLQVIWNWARKEGMHNVNWPAAGMEKSRWRNKEKARDFEVSDELFEAIYYAGDDLLRDCMDVASATGMRIKDTINVMMPEGDILRLQSSKTGKKADFDVSLSAVLPDLIRRRRKVKATHSMLLTTPTGRVVTYAMLRARWEFAREYAAINAEAAGEQSLADDLRAMFLRDMRRYASNIAATDEEASQLLQHSSVSLTRKHYRTKATQLKAVR